MTPCDVSTFPLTVMRTTAGLAFDATSTVAEDSSIVTGWFVAPMVAPVGVVAVVAAGLSNAPEAFRATTVPPDARTADNSAAPRMVPMPRFVPEPPLTGPSWTGLAGTVAAGSFPPPGGGPRGAGGASPPPPRPAPAPGGGGRARSP